MEDLSLCSPTMLSRHVQEKFAESVHCSASCHTLVQPQLDKQAVPRETSCFMRTCSASRRTRAATDTQAAPRETSCFTHACSASRHTQGQPQQDTQASAEIKTSSCLHACTLNSLLLQHSSLAATDSQLALLWPPPAYPSHWGKAAALFPRDLWSSSGRRIYFLFFKTTILKGHWIRMACSHLIWRPPHKNRIKLPHFSPQELWLWNQQ